MRLRRCRICEQKYPTIVEDDYSGECATCEDITFQEQKNLQLKTRGY